MGSSATMNTPDTDRGGLGMHWAAALGLSDNSPAVAPAISGLPKLSHFDLVALGIFDNKVDNQGIAASVIKDQQRVLAAQGLYASGMIDGARGQLTRFGELLSGEKGEALAQKFLDYYNSKSPEEVTTADKYMVQMSLNRVAGAPVLAVDGKIGNITKTALAAYNRDGQLDTSSQVTVAGMTASHHVLDDRSIVQEDIYKAFIDHLRVREGERLKVYLDTEGYATVGVGHKVLPQDGLKVGDKITREQSEAFLAEDAKSAFDKALDQADRLGISDPNFIKVLASANYQLGDFEKVFHNTFNAIKDGNFEKAIGNLQISLWNSQTPVRVADLTAALIDLDRTEPGVVQPTYTFS